MAKLNLTLEVVRRRPDGYHDLRSIFVRIGLSDELRVEIDSAAEHDRLTVEGLPGCPVDGNLVLRAFAALRNRVEPRLPALAAHLNKRIPVGGGLGGGSSDGAAALALAAAAWGIAISPSELLEIAAGLGSDVPFLAADVRAAIVEGRGERVSPLPGIAGGAALLAISDSGLSTAAAFARYDELRTDRQTTDATERLADLFRGQLTGADLAELGDQLADANDLWPAALAIAPVLGDRRKTLVRTTGRPWLLSGSGPTLFALYPSIADARHDAEKLSDERGGAELGGVILLATDLE